jgi:hypothetical protein
VNQTIYNFAVWLDGTSWSTLLHESFYMYNWVETTHVLSLMTSLGLLFLVHLRMLGFALTDIPADQVANRLRLPMIFGFSIMVITGLLLFYAIPVRSAQSLWLRFKLLLLLGAAVNALLFHRRMMAAGVGWQNQHHAPVGLRASAWMSIASWCLIVSCGRLIAYDWYDCVKDPAPIIALLAGCVDGQELF